MPERRPININTIIICITVLISILLIRDTALKITGVHSNSGGNPLSTPEEELYVSPDDYPEVPDKEWYEAPDNPYTPDLGSEYLHEIHAELDQRIEDLKKELEYEEKQKVYVNKASDGIIFSEDADFLAKQQAQKTKIEVAE